MNELLFFTHLAIALLFLWLSTRLGREALISWIVLQPLLANLFVLKQVELFGFHVTSSDIYAVACALGLNILQEHYGKESAKKSVMLCFYALVFFVAMSLLHLAYEPSVYDTTNDHYRSILGTSPRLVIASILSFSSVQWFDVQLFGYLKRKSSLSLYARNIISLASSQFMDTLLFTFLGLWGHVDKIFDIIIVSFVIKLIIALILSSTSLHSRKYEPVSL